METAANALDIVSKFFVFAALMVMASAFFLEGRNESRERAFKAVYPLLAAVITGLAGTLIGWLA